MKIKLKVENFISIKNAEIEIKPFTVLIGPQASGKSVLAKLLFFLMDVLNPGKLANSKNHDEFFKSLGIEFISIFKQNAWENQQFKITLTFFSLEDSNEDEFLQISGNKTNLNIDTTESLNKALKQFYNEKFQMIHIKNDKKLKKLIENIPTDELKNIIKNLNNEEEDSIHLNRFRKFLYSYAKERENTIKETLLYRHPLFQNIPFKEKFFIPAGRSFFSNLYKNIFTIMKNNENIDPFMIEFGSILERNLTSYAKFTCEKDNKNASEALRLCQEIAKAELIKEEGDFFVENEHFKTALSDSSSGQQEVLPMLAVLLNLSFNKEKDGLFFFIEEPEAHLFPKAQKKLIELISLIRKNNFYFLTTHSPYILTSLVNHVAAYQAHEKNTGSKNEVLKRYKNKLIAPDEISAYCLTESGEVKNIIDAETGLINAEYIDEVSEQIGSDFDTFLDLIYDDK